MTQFILCKLEQAIERGKIPADVVRKAQASKDISERALAYTILTEPHLRAQIVNFKAKSSDPVACLEYLLTCITLDLEWDEDYAHAQEEAFEELRVPLDPYWASKKAQLSDAMFWERLTTFLEADQKDTDPDLIATFLADCPKDEGFKQAMMVWQKHPALARFVIA